MRVTEVFWKNLKAYKDGFRTIVNKGSSRSSKTGSLVQVQDFIAVNSKTHKKISIVSQSYPHLRDGVIYEYDKYLMRENMTRAKKEARHEYHINKSIINYFSLDDPGKAVGPGRDILWINEPNRGVNFEAYTQLKQRTSECIWIDYNPSGKFWLHTEGILTDPRTIVIHSTWLDNIENLSAAQIHDFIDAKRKAKTDPYWAYWWKVYGLGEDGVLLEERIMPFIKQCSKVPDDAIEIPSGLDFGFADPTCFIRMWIRKKELKDELYIKEIVYDSKLSINTKSEGTSNLVEKLNSEGVNSNHRIIAESAEPRSITEMRNVGFNIEAVKKTTVETSIRTFHDYDIYIVGDSPNVLEEFENFKYARDKKTNEILSIPEKDQADHSIAASRYVLQSRNFRWSV